MRLIFTILFGILTLISSFAQSQKYSKRELKELVRKQQQEINKLLLKNEDLYKVAQNFHHVEQERFKCLAENRNLKIIIDQKDNEIAIRNREKDVLISSNVEIRKLLAESKISTSNYLTPAYSAPSTKRVSRSKRTSSYENRESRTHYITGPRGGCYYINGNGNKTYVDRSLCH